MKEWVPSTEDVPRVPWGDWGRDHQERVLKEALGDVAYELLEKLLKEKVKDGNISHRGVYRDLHRDSG